MAVEFVRYVRFKFEMLSGTVLVMFVLFEMLLFAPVEVKFDIRDETEREFRQIASFGVAVIVILYSPSLTLFENKADFIPEKGMLKLRAEK